MEVCLPIENFTMRRPPQWSIPTFYLGIPGTPCLSSTFGPGFLGLSGRSSSHSIRSIKASSPMGLPIRSCFLKSTISIPCFSHCNQVNMVRHKTIDPDLYPVLCTPLRHQLQVRLVLPIIKKRLLAPVAPPSNMLRNFRRHHFCNPCHLKNGHSNIIGIVNNSVGCSLNSKKEPRVPLVSTLRSEEHLSMLTFYAFRM
jgi:hypothetical protein